MAKIPFEILPTRLVRLKRIGIETIEDLEKIHISEILKINGIGRKSIYQLKDFVDDYRTTIGASVPVFNPKPEINDRYLNALRLRREGKKYREIGNVLNVSACRAREIVIRAERRLKLIERWEQKLKERS